MVLLDGVERQFDQLGQLLVPARIGGDDVQRVGHDLLEGAHGRRRLRLRAGGTEGDPCRDGLSAWREGSRWSWGRVVVERGADIVSRLRVCGFAMVVVGLQADSDSDGCSAVGGSGTEEDVS